jgi:hypothetical protein
VGWLDCRFSRRDLYLARQARRSSLNSRSHGPGSSTGRTNVLLTLRVRLAALEAHSVFVAQARNFVWRRLQASRWSACQGLWHKKLWAAQVRVNRASH